MRDSKFKHYLIPPEQLGEESVDISKYLELLTTVGDWGLEDLSYFFLIYFHQRGKNKWWQSLNADKRLSPQEILESNRHELAYDWMIHNQIKKIPQAISLALTSWRNDRWPLTITDQNISPEQMMHLQAQGKRIITVRLDLAKQGRLVDGMRDAFEFALHDLMHAYHFFSNPENYLEQVEFFKKIQNDFEVGELKKMCDLDSEFKKNIEYVMSDMNTNIHHLQATYNAHIIHFKRNHDQGVNDVH